MNFRSGRYHGRQLKVGSGENSYFIGSMDAKGRYEGQVIYLYPNLTKVIIGMLFESINGLLAEACLI